MKVEGAEPSSAHAAPNVLGRQSSSDSKREALLDASSRDREATPIVPTRETDPVPHDGDAADDPAIWLNPKNPAMSTIIGTDKKGGLAVYDLAGKQIQYLAEGRMNNVDLRPGFRLRGERVALVTAGNRSDDTIAVYRVQPTTRMLVPVAARPIELGLSAYGSCMYRSRRTGAFYVFMNSKEGEVEQWQLFDDGRGKVDARRVRRFDVGLQTEGCVADDALAHLYIGEENKGIWKYGAEPTAGTARTLVDSTGSDGHLEADVEGLTLAYGAKGTGYLIASSQGDNSFVIYRREGKNAYVRTFTLEAGNGIDEVSDTDGIDVTTARLGSAFPTGLFVVQDGENDEGNQNFKLVPWRAVSPTGTATRNSARSPSRGGAADGSFIASTRSRRAVVWAVGDGGDGSDEAKALARTIKATRPHRLLYLGDVYPEGSAADFSERYAPVYGRLASITAPTPGNHDWPRHEEGYDRYWKRVTGKKPPPYYSFTAGGWQLLSLNSEAPHGPLSAQLSWLRTKLRRPGTCRLAFWHRPRFSAGTGHGDQEDVAPLWDALRQRAAIVVNAHDHDMQRLRPRDGITQFVSGAGGHSRYEIDFGYPGLAFGNDGDSGALRLELRRGVARYAFVTAEGRTLDSGSVSCRP
jgi:3-phytase